MTARPLHLIFYRIILWKIYPTIFIFPEHGNENKIKRLKEDEFGYTDNVKHKG